jgi:hypothetical protein
VTRTGPGHAVRSESVDREIIRDVLSGADARAARRQQDDEAREMIRGGADAEASRKRRGVGVRARSRQRRDAPVAARSPLNSALRSTDTVLTHCSPDAYRSLVRRTSAPGYGWGMHFIEDDRISRPVKPAARTGESADPTALLEMLIDAQPAAAPTRIRSLVTVSQRLRSTIADQLDDAIAADRRLDTEIDRIATGATRAQETFEKWAAERVDRLLADLAETFAESARDLAEATVRETGFGNVAERR